MRPSFIRFVCCSVALAAAAAGAALAGPAAFAVRAAVAQKPPPLIDGTLNDAAWSRAVKVDLGWNFTLQRRADEPTTVYLLADAKYLYVAFAARQREAIVATQHSNDQPLTNDDAVRIYVWPSGSSGIEYSFASNPIGTRSSTSTENTAFAPRWKAVGKAGRFGYVVTERIPLDVMRGEGHGEWRLQFDRTIHATNETMEWAYAGGQTQTDASLYAGALLGMNRIARAARVHPRVALYALGETAQGAAGRWTSRAGMDVSVPITRTSSFVATFHPDYSNVELDQQSISPTVFPRRLAEVRPFFTQGANFDNDFDCNDCQSFPLLYTPAIPTPRSGYAIEGTQGSLQFAAFDAIGEQRDDVARSMLWRSTDHRYEALYQRVDVDLPGVHDAAEYYGARADNLHNFSAYVTLGDDHGTNVATPGAGRYNEYGVNLYTPKSGVYAAYHDVGDQYRPYDSITSVNGVAGPTVYTYREWDNGPQAFIQSIKPTIDLEWLRDPSGNHRFASGTLDLSVASRNQWSLDVTAGSTYIRLPDIPGGAVNQNGISLTYGQNTPTASSIAYRSGHYGAGFLRSTDVKTAFHVTRLATLSLEAYGTEQTFTDRSRLQEWLERASLAVQITPGESVAVGWRKIIGTGPVFFESPTYIDATNLSCAYYRRFKTMELYLAYGTPNELNTQHDVLMKIIRYIGADKGT